MQKQITKQVSGEGLIVDDVDPTHPSFAEVKNVLIEAFNFRQWQNNITSSDEEKRLVEMQVSKGGRNYELKIFIFLNLANSSRNNPDEKRIQLRRPNTEHRTEFSLPNTGQERCLLLGMYFRDGKVLVAAWRANDYVDHGMGTSCYIRVQALADAMRDGFGQYIDSKDRIVCCFQPDFLPYYVENIRKLHEQVTVEKVVTSDATDSTDLSDVERNNIPANLPRNRVIYGAPGTGKSHKIDSEVTSLFKSELLYERVTFHPEYTYGQFVGAYRPRPIYRETESQLFASDRVSATGSYEPLIDYVFVPGPLIRMLARALKFPQHNFVLMIEELNRANAPAVFGEIFQLLDRDETGDGKFSVTVPPEVQDYLKSEGLPTSVRLPKNLYIWATMNSADQGVMPLDAAFKRRWNFEYVPLNSSENVTSHWSIFLKFLGTSVSWNVFRNIINRQLQAHGVSDDRLIGPFFMGFDELNNESAFKNKLLLYLRDDVVRHSPDVLFKGASLSYGAIVEAYDRGENIFIEGVNFA